MADEPNNTAVSDPSIPVPSKTAVKMIDELKAPKKELRLRDKNWSWPFFILVLAYVLTLAIVAVRIYGTGSTGGNVMFLLATLVGGGLAGIILYNLGKLIFANASGYSMDSFDFSGIHWEKGRNRKWYFVGSDFLEFHSHFVPKKEKLDADPLAMSLGGLIVWAIAFGIVLALAFTMDFSLTVKWGLVFGAALSASYPIYQASPFREDIAPDIYVLVSTRNRENRKAFNLLAINQANAFADKDLLVPDFKDYETYWKARTLRYLYLDKLYKGEVEDCIKLLSQAHYLSPLLSDKEKAIAAGERLFILVLLNDRSGADNLFIMLPKSIKVELVRASDLSQARSAFIVSGLILDRSDASNELVTFFKTNLPSTSKSIKVSKEKQYFTLAYDKVKELNPNFKLPQM